MTATWWEIVGVICIVVGVAAVYAPAGVIAAGVYCLLLAGTGGDDDGNSTG